MSDNMSEDVSEGGGREFFAVALSEAIYTAFKDTDPIVFEFLDKAMSNEEWIFMVDRVIDSLSIKIRVKTHNE